MSEPKVENIFGAVIFFAYIGAALSFTGLIINDLFKLSGQRAGYGSLSPATSRKVQVMSALAALSFSVLSYHMLHFLILSYTTWARKEEIALPKFKFVQSGIPEFDQSSLQVWQWAKSSTLFNSFAQVICDDSHRFWWTQQALSYSIMWNYFMSFQGRRLGVPRLWAYFVLDQILPLSFTQNLFCVATYLSAPKEKGSRTVLSAPPPMFQVLPVVSYLALVYLAPSSVEQDWFLWVVISTRVLLFVPYLVIRPGKQSPIRGLASDRWQKVLLDFGWMMTSLIAGGLVMHMMQTSKIISLSAALSAVNDSPAVSALGYDYLIAAASLMVYQGMDWIW